MKHAGISTEFKKTCTKLARNYDFIDLTSVFFIERINNLCPITNIITHAFYEILQVLNKPHNYLLSLSNSRLLEMLEIHLNTQITHNTSEKLARNLHALRSSKTGVKW